MVVCMMCIYLLNVGPLLVIVCASVHALLHNTGFTQANKCTTMSVEDLEEVWERAITVARVEHSNRLSEITCTVLVRVGVFPWGEGTGGGFRRNANICLGTGLFERKQYDLTSLLTPLDHMVTLKNVPDTWRSFERFPSV